MKKKKQQPEIPEATPVKLKPILGMRPGLYLTILYAVVILLLFLLVFVYPGLKKNGAETSFSSLPEGAAVYMDGVYLGSTPFSTFVEKGRHTFTFEKPFFTTLERTRDIRGRIFATLLFPRREKISTRFEEENLQKYLNFRFEQVSNWALVGAFFDRYRYPDRGSTTVGELLPYFDEKEAEIPLELYNFAYMLINNISSSEMLEDALHSFELLSPKAGPDFYDSLDSDLLNLYILLLTEASASEEPIKSSMNALASRRRDLSFEESYTQPIRVGTPVKVLGHRYNKIELPPTLPLGNESLDSDPSSLKVEQLSTFPHSEKIESFHIDSSEVTRAQFDLFIEEVPKWSLKDTDALVEEGLVDDQYLKFLRDGDYDKTLPVTHVSWFAARAYCEWLTTKLPSSLAGSYIVRLPTESEWEGAARMNGDSLSLFADSNVDSPQSALFTRAGRLGLADMTGNVWEWCENWYFPSDLIDGKYGAAKPGFRGVEKSIRGGSWANPPQEIFVWTRASQPPQWSSPFTGFRTVLAKKDLSEIKEF